MNNEEIILLKQLLNRERSLSFLAEKIGKSEYEIMAQISSMKENGDNIVDVYKNGDIYIKDYGDNSLEELAPYYINTENSNKIQLIIIGINTLL